MMDLKLVNDYSTDTLRLYCGPAALAIIAGIPAKTAVLMCAAIAGNPDVAQWWHLSRALFAFGWRIEMDDAARGLMMSQIKPRCLVVVQCPTMTHYVVVEDGMMIDNKNPVPVKITPEQDKPTLHVWKITPLDHGELVPYPRFKGAG